MMLVLSETRQQHDEQQAEQPSSKSKEVYTTVRKDLHQSENSIV